MWLEQHCGRSLTLESDKVAVSSTEVEHPQLRPALSSATLVTVANSATTASFSWNSSPLLSISTSPTTPSSPTALGPPFSDASRFQTLTRAHPETEAARADSPLLGFPALAANVTAAPTIPLSGADLDKVRLELTWSCRFSD